ncbi:MAG TPA: Holliday junction resolvase RuvX [Acidimicrobiales bacterium]|nr:Holliday junction resolvase RuvX [Acidimicrobiales bacterium]
MRAVGIDLGTKRIGVAVSDPSGTLASPYEVVARSGDVAADHRRLAAIVAEVEAEVVVVGLPLALSGEVGRAAQSALDEVEAMRAVLPVPVETHDERLTTVSADRSMMERKMKADARRRVVDKVAAAVMLQSWLDGRRARR